MSSKAIARAESTAFSKELTSESRIVAILESFERQVDGIRGSAVADDDGLPIANGFREPFDLLSVASMSALGMQSSKKVFELIGLEGPSTVVLEGMDAKVVIQELGGGRASFIAVVRPDAKLGFLKLQMASAARRLEEELGFVGPSDAHVEEVFLLTDAGLLISHASRTLIHPKDRDILASMMTVVQQFVRDTFNDKGGPLEEMQLAHLHVRLIRGRTCTIAVVASGSIGDAYLAAARASLTEFEEKNRPRLESWNGDASTLEGADSILEDLLHRRPS